jgi:hypothetical protein
MPAAVACTQPGRWSVAAAFDLAANGLLPPSYPQFPPSSKIHAIPPSILKAVGWVESGWHQFAPQGHPLVSFDFGYGIMQVTSGMAGAFGKVGGDIDPQTQSQIASDYIYNIAYGSRMLVTKWESVPPVGTGDPAVVENWYYALWAYNGWGWVNNPNNPRFTRQGTPASYPSTYPYQERVLYLVAHPPKDASGNPMWQAVPVTLPSNKQIGSHPGRLTLSATHRQDPPQISAVYRPSPLKTVAPGLPQPVVVRVTNTGTTPWLATGPASVSLTYHVFTQTGDPWQPISPFSNGVIALGQGAVPLPHDLLPGATAAIKATLIAPDKVGSFRIAWDLEEGSSQWFSQLGALPRVQGLRVQQVPTPPGPPSMTPPPTPITKENLQYVADTSIPDGTTLPSGQTFVKGWLVFNNGQTAWKQNWALHLVSGPGFGARAIPVPPTQQCRSANIVAQMRSPGRIGTFKSVWQMEDAQGHPFGQRLTLVVTLTRAGVRPTPVPTLPSTPAPRPTQTPVAATPTPVG